MKRFYYPLALALALLCSAPALAKDDGKSPAETPGRRAVRTQFMAAHTFEADVEDDRGEVAVTRFLAGASYGPASLRYVRDVYQWSDASNLPLGDGSDDPWDSLQLLTLGISSHEFITPEWGWFGNLNLLAGYEDEFGGLGAAAGGGAIWNASKTVQVRVGAMASVSPVGLVLLPVLGVDINRQAEKGWSAALGMPVTEVRYRWSPRWATRVGASYDTSTYRLADDSTVEPEGYVSSSAIVTGLYQDYSAGALTCTLGLEYRTLRSLDVYNEDGEHRNAYGLGAAPGIVARLGWAF